jgi:hypothetical protein
VIKYKEIKWYFYQGALFPSEEPHINIILSQKEGEELLEKSKAFFLRYTNEWDRKESEFWYVTKDKFDGLTELSGNTRSKVRRGLKNCKVLRVSQEEITKEGYDIYLSAMKSYTTNLKPISKKEYQKNKVNSDNYDIWAVYEKETGRMIAYSSNKIINNSCNYTEIKFHPAYMKLYPSYALFYEMNRYYLDEVGMQYIHDGARSISHETNIHNFLIDKFKFRKVYCKLNVIYRKDIAIIVNVLYPLRMIISTFNFSMTNKISVLLKQEEIRRSFEK